MFSDWSDWSEYIDIIIDKWTKLVYQITTFPFPFKYSIWLDTIKFSYLIENMNKLVWKPTSTKVSHCDSIYYNYFIFPAISCIENITDWEYHRFPYTYDGNSSS